MIELSQSLAYPFQRWTRRLASKLCMLLLSAMVLAVPAVQAAEPTPPEARSAAPSGASPWEHDLWSGSTGMMRLYVCSHARRNPSWCEEDQRLPSKAPLPEEHGPPLTAEDAAWLAFLEETDPNALTAQDVEVIRRRASVRRDPQAMEILGFIYAQGGAVERNYAEAYRWYGRAYLAGERRVRPNMDIVWNLLQRHDLEAALALTREFNALNRGEQLPMNDPADAAATSSGADRQKTANPLDPTGL